MNYTKSFVLTSNWRKKNNTLLKFVCGLVGLFAAIFILNFFSSPVKNFFYAASEPIERNFWLAGQSVSDISKSVLSAGFLANENENLKKENQNLISEINFLQAQLDSREALMEIYGSPQNNDFSLVMVGVTGLDKQGVLSVDKGSESGMLVGMPVINQQKVIFGKIIEVHKNFSKILLISDSSSVINVKVQQIQTESSEENIYGVVKGKDGLGAYLDLVPVEDTIKKGDVLVTSALEGTFPKNLLVGKIIGINKNDQSPHQQADVELYMNIGSENLFVIVNYKH